MFFFFFPPQLWQENILLQSQIAKHHLWKISFSLFSFIFLSTPTTADRQTEAPVWKQEKKKKSTSKQTQEVRRVFHFGSQTAPWVRRQRVPPQLHTGRHLRKSPLFPVSSPAGGTDSRTDVQVDWLPLQSVHAPREVWLMADHVVWPSWLKDLYLLLVLMSGGHTNITRRHTHLMDDMRGSRSEPSDLPLVIGGSENRNPLPTSFKIRFEKIFSADELISSYTFV